MTERLVVSAAQFESVPRQVARNVQAAWEGIAAARELGAALVVLPEYCLSGYDGQWIKEGAPGGGSELGGGPLESIAAASADLGISVVLNDLERHEGRLFSTSFIVTGGRVVGLHRKTVVTEGEALAGVAEGDSAAVPVSLLGMTIPVAPMICFEHGFPEIAMDLALAGAGVIAISSAIQDGTQYLRNLRTRARAQDNGCYVIAANSVGGGYCGESMIVDPRGDVMARASSAGPDVIVAEVDAGLVAASRKAEPVLRLRRPELRPKASPTRAGKVGDGPKDSLMSTRPHPKGALDGILVADFGRVLAGPYATMLLADLGAEVIKIERPGIGDDTRAWGPPWVHGDATYFLGVNRNKRSAVLDLTSPDGLDAARRLAARADVVVENFRPGTMHRLGLGYESIRAVNPGVVYCSITGFGDKGGADLAGYDLLVQAVGGLMSVTGADASQPTKVGVALVDVITGLHAALGILAALRHRDATGEGQRVDVNLLTSLLSALSNQSSAFLNAGVIPEAMGNQHPSIAPYEVFPTADRPLAVAVGNDRQFLSMVRAMGLTSLAGDERFSSNAARVAHREELFELLSARLTEHTADDWFDILTAVGVPVGPINDIQGAFALAARLGLEPVVEIPDSFRQHHVRQAANPIRLSQTPASYRLAPPALGADTLAVLEALWRPQSPHSAT